MALATFTNMTPADRASWQAWARSHDWGRHALIQEAYGHSFLVLPLTVDGEGDSCAGGHCEPTFIQNGYVGFARPAVLQIWAGY